MPLFLIGKISRPRVRKLTVAAFYIVTVLLLMIFVYLGLFRGAISPLDIRWRFSRVLLFVGIETLSDSSQLSVKIE